MTVALTVPTLLALGRIRSDEIDPDRAHGAIPRTDDKGHSTTSIAVLARNRPLLEFALVVMLFQFANAAMLPLVGSFMTTQSATWAPALIATCMIVPQIVVALMSPWVGRRAQSWGRRPLLLIATGALVFRGVLFAFVRDPYLLVVIQVLDGMSAAVLSVLIPLVVVDVTYGSRHFNSASGRCWEAIGLAPRSAWF